MCCNTTAKGTVRIIDDNMDKMFPTQIAAVGLDDSQFFTLKLKRGNFRLSDRHSVWCNVIQLTLYKQSTNVT